jgi:hypothetical protein
MSLAINGVALNGHPGSSRCGNQGTFLLPVWCPQNQADRGEIPRRRPRSDAGRFGHEFDLEPIGIGKIGGVVLWSTGIGVGFTEEEDPAVFESSLD